MSVTSILKDLKKLGSAENRAGMARFGINADNAFGIKMPILRSYAKNLGTNHMLAIDLWETGNHEARLTAVFIADKKQLTDAFMEKWLKDFDSWDICDQTVMSLFDKHPSAYLKAIEWSKRKEEIEKRAGFAMMASLAVHDKKMPDQEFRKFYEHIVRGSTDERNFVKKAVNWALRQIGKRSRILNKETILIAEKISKLDSKSAKWVAADALRELKDPKIRSRIKR